MGFGKEMLRLASSATRKAVTVEEAINRSKEVISESLEICRTSANPETRISRMGVAIEYLTQLCEEYPYWPDASAWHKQGHELAEAYPGYIVANLSELIAGRVKNIEKLKNQKPRHERAEKLVEKLKPYLSIPACDTTWLASQIFLVKKAYPPEGTQPILEAEIPTPWKPDFNKNNDSTPYSVKTEINHVPSVPPLSWVWKIGIWVACSILLSPLAQISSIYAIVSFTASIILTIIIVKGVNKRRIR